MNLNSIFQHDEADEGRVPEIEVRGNRLRVPKPEPQVGGQEDSPGEPQNTRELSLPKTKWF